MCRNIKQLRRTNELPSDDELRDAALQFVRKISGYRKPSQVNQAAFDRAVGDVTAAGRALFERLHSAGKGKPASHQLATTKRQGARLDRSG